MSMETLNVIQFIQLLLGYIGFTVGLPALVFYPKVKRFPASVRFLSYFTIGNFCVINLVQVLQLLHISYRVTLLTFTLVPAALLAVRLYRIPVVPYGKKVLGDCRHYLLRELGFKSFLRRRWQELRGFLRVAGRNLLRLLKENVWDVPFLVFFCWLVWAVCGPGILDHWGYGASDVPVHNYWINGLIDNNIYVAGIYPMGMHCMLYYLSQLLGLPVYVTLRLFWLVQYSVIAVMLLAFLKGHCKNRALPYLGCFLFVGGKYFVGISYSRYGATLPQEFGMLYILPSIFFALEFFQARTEELEKGVNRLLSTSTWLLLGFAMSFSMTLSAHFYDTIIAGVICVGIAAAYGYWFWRKEYFFRVMLAGILSILMAFLPMAAAFLTGKPLQGSMYWAMSIIGLKAYTVLIFRVICVGVVAVTLGGAFLIFRGVKSGRLSLENRAVPVHSTFGKLILQLCGLLPVAAVFLLGWKYREKLLWGCQQNALALPDMDWVLYGFAAALVIGLVLRYLVDPMRGAGLLAMASAEIMLGLILVSGSLGWPILMEPYRVCIYFAYLLPVLLVMTLDGVLCIPFGRFPAVRQIVSFAAMAVLLLYSPNYPWMRAPFGGGRLEMNEAILCTTNILKDNEGRNDKWTIVSANDEYRMVEKYGRHTETIEFLEDMEHWNPTKEVSIPTETVYFYIEKQPLNYAGGYAGKIPPVSEEQASKPLPKNAGLNAYNGADRSVTMSRMYYWAQAFQALYPNEMKVYYENERFVCYRIQQNVYRLYNFAIDYGYN